MKDESLSTPLSTLPAVPARFTHSHPRPRDPADPTVRPYPRGRPRTPKTISASAPSSSMSFAEALGRERGMMEEEKGEEEEEEVKEDRVRTRVVRRVKEEEKVVEGMVDSEVEEVEGEVSYVRLGKPARMRRSKAIALRKRSASRKRGKVGALLANWNRLNKVEMMR